MTDFIPRIKALGADYIWLSPIYPSPGLDHGYDVSNYEAIDIRHGTMQDFDNFVHTAHEYSIGVMMDLVINHTSIQHPWFREKPQYYYWSNEYREGWHNLFDEGPAWAYDEKQGQYYLHLFHESQADLAWFDEDGNLNEFLANEFRRIAYYWIGHGVDGFRIDVPQAVNKNAYGSPFEMDDLLYGGRAIRVLNSIFSGLEAPVFLIAELLDPTDGRLARTYVLNTELDYVDNILLKENAAESEEGMLECLEANERSGYNVLELESHDSPRFASVSGLDPEDIIWAMFRTDCQCICLYQGQELGLKNPTPEELPDEELLRLDAQTAMRHARGQSLADLRLKSRANARVALPMAEYKFQEFFPDSYLNLTKEWIKRWKER